MTGLLHRIKEFTSPHARTVSRRRVLATIAGGVMATGLSMSVATAGQAPEAEQFIAGLADRAVAILENEALSKDERIGQFSDLVMDNTDIDAIALFSLGRYRRVATEAQIDEYNRLFRDYTKNFYDARLSLYSGERLRITGSVIRAPGDIVVNSELTLPQTGQPVPLNWRLATTDDGFIIRDLQALGVWLAIEQRSQFDSVISNNGGRVEALLSRLRTMVANGEGLATETN